MDDTPLAKAPFLAWPGWSHLGFTIVVGSVWSVVFYLIYGGAAWLTDQHDYRLVLGFPFETRIPLVTAMSLPYLGLFPLMMLSPFIIRNRGHYWDYAAALTIEVFIAAVFFILLPLEERFPPSQPTGFFKTIFGFADLLNLDHNNLPSLHVAFGVTTALAFAPFAQTKLLRWSIAACALLVAISTVLTHQHHIVDAVSGYLLAHVVCRRVLRIPAERISE